ncbi:ferredoxin [Rhodococcus sp. BH5]|uniref:ferredoxin n=1 Tax=Rhodococcus sp. BH5 TaxID=2871702 RepID=UPI002FD550E1
MGAGPAAMYTVRELLNRSTSIHVTVYELHDAVGGLLQRGVSLNNPGVRKMSRLFDLPFHDDRVTTILNTEVGRDISINELRTEYDAVILACGASQPRQVGRDLCGNGIYQALDILVGENDPASVSSPSALTGPVCIVVGAGNVAFDIVRWVAENRHQASKNSQVRELLVLSRSAPESAAFTRSAFYELLDLADADILIDSDGDLPGAESALLCELSQLPSTVFCGMHTLPTDTTGPLRIILSFGQEVAELAQEGSSAVAVTTIKGRIFHANSTICATGFTTKWINGVPLNEHGFVPNRSGQVVSPETGEPLIGLYVVGWAKRGASGGVGENRACAAETVAQLVADRHSRV